MGGILIEEKKEIVRLIERFNMNMGVLQEDLDRIFPKYIEKSRFVDPFWKKLRDNRNKIQLALYNVDIQLNKYQNRNFDDDIGFFNTIKAVFVAIIEFFLTLKDNGLDFQIAKKNAHIKYKMAKYEAKHELSSKSIEKFINVCDRALNDFKDTYVNLELGYYLGGQTNTVNIKKFLQNATKYLKNLKVDLENIVESEIELLKTEKLNNMRKGLF